MAEGDGHCGELKDRIWLSGRPSP